MGSKQKKDPKDDSYTQQVPNWWDTKNREDLEKMKKIKLHKDLRHCFGLEVKSQQLILLVEDEKL